MWNYLGGEEIEDHEGYRGYIPHLTIIFILICLALFVGINLERDPYSWAAHNNWGAFSASDIWRGKWWSLLTSNFLHVEIWHITFNMYWLWIFGKRIEFLMGRFFLLVFTVLAGVVVSTMQMSFSDNTGIGFSGIGYAYFGFIYIQGKHKSEWQLPASTIQLFIVWLFVCIAITWANLISIGNIAHFSGIIYGGIVGFSFNMRYKALSFIIPLAVFGITLIPLKQAPWNARWLFLQAYDADTSQNYSKALLYYDKTLAVEPDNESARDNEGLIFWKLGRRAELNDKEDSALLYYNKALQKTPDDKDVSAGILRIKELRLAHKAYDEHLAKNYEMAIMYYDSIIDLASHDSLYHWAIVNKNKIVFSY